MVEPLPEPQALYKGTAALEQKQGLSWKVHQLVFDRTKDSSKGWEQTVAGKKPVVADTGKAGTVEHRWHARVFGITEFHQKPDSGERDAGNEDTKKNLVGILDQ